jgi:hypothetical protein
VTELPPTFTFTADELGNVTIMIVICILLALALQFIDWVHRIEQKQKKKRDKDKFK